MWSKLGEGLPSEANATAVLPNSLRVAREPRDLEDVKMQIRKAQNRGKKQSCGNSRIQFSVIDQC